MPDLAADLSYNDVEGVRIDAPPDRGTGTGQERDGELATANYEADNEEDDDEEEETESGGEETVDATQHWTDQEAEARLIEVCKWIAWQGHLRMKQPVWRGA